MANKMLIDASHREETRVVVLRGNRIEEFDFESEARKQLRGNIYLARVTRVEPSLQAAFVEYGGNRHGFLAFSEIHPDYYQIPVADRQALLEEEAEEARQQDAEDDENTKEKSASRKGRRRRGKPRAAQSVDEEATDSEASDDDQSVMAAEIVGDFTTEELDTDNDASGDDDSDDDANGDDANGDDDVESVGAEDAMEEVPDRRRTQRRQYRIQEVIKRRQILLVQVVKEERGNKGAALTTYLSLAGRYSVLMPNTARGGGISRKITQLQDRKRLKDVVRSLEVPQGMGVILRTAGANRTKAEIKRDYEYLMRMWENVRNLTLQSTAPCLVYEEGSLIKRAIRDLYNKDIDQIMVAGEDGYREAKDFMRMLMPSHAKAVQPYRDTLPIFARNGIEAQLDRMLQPQVTLKSGGYIIINQTEALVSIDVNSGRSTREHSIEDTALQTNLEAAEEVARQLRLRDLAGLIVIDFIDMDEKRNNRAVEKRMKDCLKHDRARIQVGRISHFGLLEMSRQRIRASVLESAMKPCPHCGGIGLVRSDSSEALHVIRSIEEYLLKSSSHDVVVRTSTHTAFYILNQKRSNIQDLEQRFGLHIALEPDDTLGHVHYAIDRGDPASGVPALPAEAIQIDYQDLDDVEDEDDIVDDAEADDERSDADSDGDGDGDGNRRKRRRRRRGRRGGNGSDGDAMQARDGDDDNARRARDDNDDEPRRRRRRGKRGGRRNRRDFDTPQAELVGWSEEELQALKESAAAEAKAAEAAASAETTEATDSEAPATAAETRDDSGRKRGGRRGSRRPAQAASDDVTAEVSEEAPADATPVDTDASQPEDAGTGDEAPVEPPAEEETPPARVETVTPAEAVPVDVATVEPDKPKRSGWWQKRSFF